jgi:DNA primase
VDWQEILEQVNIVDYISQYTDLVEKDGELWGNCPLHKEKTPSFSVNKDEQTFYCFGCNAGGNLASFVMDYESCTFPQAMRKIKDFFKIVDNSEYLTIPDIIKVLKKFQPKVKKCKEFCQQELNDYCINKYRKLDIKEWQEEGISQSVMDIFNVRYDLEDRAIVFEVRDNDGKLISLKKRTLVSNYTPKYKYTHKIGSSNFLWALYYTKAECIKSGEIILVEGEKSVMKLLTWGVNNCAAICTSHIDDEQLKTLLQMKLNVVIALDKDKQKKIKDDPMFKKLSRFCKTYVIYDYDNLLGEKDAPVDKGLSVWKELYNKKKILS